MSNPHLQNYLDSVRNDRNQSEAQKEVLLANRILNDFRSQFSRLDNLPESTRHLLLVDKLLWTISIFRTYVLVSADDDDLSEPGIELINQGFDLLNSELMRLHRFLADLPPPPAPTDPNIRFYRPPSPSFSYPNFCNSDFSTDSYSDYESDEAEDDHPPHPGDVCRFPPNDNSEFATFREPNFNLKRNRPDPPRSSIEEDESDQPPKKARSAFRPVSD